MKEVSSSAFIMALLFAGLATSQVFQPKEGIQTLVLLDDWALVESHSIFFDSLRKDGHQLFFEMANPPPTIKYYEQYYYDNIILMAPSIKELRSPITNKDLIQFLESNHNVMIFGDSDVRKPVRALANEFGVEFENIGYEVRDYEQEYILQNDQNVVFSSNFFEPLTSTSKGIFTKSEKPIAFSGVGQIIDPSNKFVFPILRAEPSTFSYNQDKNEISKVSGEQLTLVSGYQTRGNQRVTVSGSLSICSNNNILLTLGSDGSLKSSANYKFCKELYQWAFQQRGVLKLSNMRHVKKGDEWTGVNPENYRIKDEIDFFVDLEQKNPDGSFVPYDANDVQLEFIRLDPFHRLVLSHDNKKSSTYHAKFVVPDTLGIYKFKVSYWRYGYSYIEAETEVSCIQFRHDEYPRFLTVAFPYYANCFLIMGAGFLFVIFFLFSEVEKGPQKRQQ